jgi:hypothetical protein
VFGEGRAELGKNRVGLAFLNLGDDIAQVPGGQRSGGWEQRAEFSERLVPGFGDLRFYQLACGRIVVAEQAQKGVALFEHGAAVFLSTGHLDIEDLAGLAADLELDGPTAHCAVFDHGMVPLRSVERD